MSATERERERQRDREREKDRERQRDRERKTEREREKEREKEREREACDGSWFIFQKVPLKTFCLFVSELNGEGMVN